MRLLLLLAALLPLPASALEQVALQLKWKHQFQFAGYYAAQEKGYYRDAGLEVSVIEAGPETDPVREVLDGRAQFGEDLGRPLDTRQRDVEINVAAAQQHGRAVQRAGVRALLIAVLDEAAAQPDDAGVAPRVARGVLGGQAAALREAEQEDPLVRDAGGHKRPYQLVDNLERGREPGFVGSDRRNEAVGICLLYTSPSPRD